MMLRWILPLLLFSTTPNLYAGMWDSISHLFNGEQNKEQTIKVLLEEEVEGVMLQVTGGHNIYDSRNGRRQATRFSGKSAFIQPIHTGIKWGELFPNVHQLVFVPDHENSTILIDGRQYEGSVYVYAVEGKLNIVNELPIESYLTSRLAEQFPEPLEKEALNAVAIVARTDAYYQATNGKNRFWNVRARDINFNGYTHAQQLPHIVNAVAATRGMMMSTQGAATPFAAQWTEHSAGRTVPYHLIFRRDAAAPAVGVHSYLAESDRDTTQWTYSVDKETLARIGGLQRLSDITLHADNESGKIFAVHLSDGTYSKDIDFLTLREELGVSRLQSSDFTIITDDKTVTFSGVGKGHGVGLCLYTAEKMAEQGENASKILDAFFPSTNISMIPDKKPAPPKQRRRSRRA